MSLLAGAHIFVGSICLAVSLLHLAIFLRRTESKVHLIFSIMALCCAVSTVLDIGMHRATDVATFAMFFKSSNTFQVLLWIAFMWLIRFYTGNNRRWAILLVSGLYAVAGLLNLIFPHGILFDYIDHLDFISLPWGERIAFAIGPANPWRLLPDVAWFLLLAYALDSCIRMGRLGQMRRAIFFGVSLFACLGIGYLHGTLIDLGLLPPPSIWIFTFLALIILMSGSLVDQVVQVPVLRRQLASQETKAQQDLADEKARMDVILSSLNTGLALINPNLTIAWVNAKTQDILPWEELVGKLCYEAAAKRKEPCEGCGALKAFADGQIHETKRQSPIDGKWHHIISIPIKDESGTVANVLESVTDITEFKQAEEARNRAMQELEDLKSKLEQENIYLKSEIEEARFSSKIIGKSNALLYVLSRLNEVAETDSTVLIQGETGVGKELMARAVHEAGERAQKPFVKVNCAALPQNLVESELFGHEKGAFTGAERLRKGRFEVADGGTIFLDEVSELPPGVQAKLLNVLQEGEFERVGGNKTLKADVRIIAASNRNVNEEVLEGRFRADLYYRLNVFPITVPPLRKRKADIPLLIEYFVPQIASQIGKHIDQIPPVMMERLMAYDWPGNVRELRNVLERAVITSRSSVLQMPAEFESKSPDEARDVPQEWTSLDEVERRYILKVLEKTEGRIEGPGGAAELLQLKPSTLRFRIKKLGINRKRT